jgi:hypothetical protein
MRWLAVGFGAFFLAGCASARVREDAALALECPEWKVSVEEKKPGTWIGRGCDRQTVCSLSSKADSEPSCIKGMPQVEQLNR